MAKGISIPISSDGRAFAEGVKSGVLEPLKDTERALDDVDRKGTEAGEGLERAFEQAQDDTRKLARENRDLADTIQREARKSSRSIRDIGDEGFSKSSDAVRGFKDEAVQNFSEVASSFDGSISGAVDGIQGTLGGLATAITGPIGLALGGLGIVAGTVATQWAEKAEQIAADWRTMYDDMVESGAAFLSQELINERIQEITADQGKLNEAIATGQSIGVGYTTVVRAQAGDMEALRSVLSAARDELAEQTAAQDEFIAKNGDESAAIADKQGNLELLIASYERMIGSQDSAGKAADTARRAMEESAAATDGARGANDRFSDSVRNIPETKPVKITADSSAFFAEMERIRQQTFEVTGSIYWEHRGTQLP